VRAGARGDELLDGARLLYRRFLHASLRMWPHFAPLLARIELLEQRRQVGDDILHVYLH
jgi:hypothetical protein